MYHPRTDEFTDSEATTHSPLRGLLIAVPVAVGLWVAVVEVARFFL